VPISGKWSKSPFFSRRLKGQPAIHPLPTERNAILDRLPTLHKRLHRGGREPPLCSFRKDVPDVPRSSFGVFEETVRHGVDSVDAFQVAFALPKQSRYRFVVSRRHPPVTSMRWAQ
jgi:hypothetical protein